MAWQKKHNPNKYKLSQIVLAVILLVILLIVGVLLWPMVTSWQDSNEQRVGTSLEEPSNSDAETENIVPEPSFDAIVLQQVIDDWNASFSGSASVVLMDEQGEIIAQITPDQQYFSASIYKLFVAYAGYMQVDAGEVNPEETYINGQTRGTCLDLMIRDSDSPCAEKLWAELGRQELTTQLQGYGITNTDMIAITTTARDSSLLLARIARGEGLSDESQVAFLDSMKDQDDLYRRGLPSGFTRSTVFNKVGWNELLEWHDTSIIEFNDGRKLIISVFTENVGSRAVANLGAAIEAAVQ